MPYCTECGTEATGDQRFCEACGHALSQPAEIATHGALAMAPSPASAPVEMPREAVVSTAPIPAFLAERKWLVLASLILAGLLVGVVAGFALPQGEPGEIVADARIGPDGGNITFDDGQGELQVPEGAVSQPERIIIRKTVIRDQVRTITPTGAVVFPPGTLVIYVFQPATIVFNSPVTIVLPIPAGAPAGNVFVFANGQITFLGGRVNLNAGTVRVQVSSFAFSSTVVAAQEAGA